MTKIDEKMKKKLQTKLKEWAKLKKNVPKVLKIMDRKFCFGL